MAGKISGTEPLRSTFADDPEMRELIELFVQEMPARIRALEASWDERRTADLQRLAHQLKGASAGYGFHPIGAAAARLEEPLKRGEADIDRLREEFRELVELCSRAST